jgi:hypothetical protein
MMYQVATLQSNRDDLQDWLKNCTSACSCLWLGEWNKSDRGVLQHLHQHLHESPAFTAAGGFK